MKRMTVPQFDIMSAEEAMNWLESKGINFKLCDAIVPLLGNEVNCGSPLGIGDEWIEGYYYLPKSELGNNPMVDWPARGESMIGDGIEDGDILRVELGAMPRDGKVVVASIDNEYTTKVYFTDPQGRQWLCPRNTHYNCILLNERMNVRIVGVVRNIIKQTPEHSYRECMAMVSATEDRQKQKCCLLERVCQAARAGAHLFWAGSAWAVVYCVLRDCFDYTDTVSEFERNAAKFDLPDSFEHRCGAGKVQRTISNHPYMRLDVNKWKDRGAADREAALVDFLKAELQDLPKTVTEVR